MLFKRNIDYLLLICVILFSIWLFGKSFGFEQSNNSLWVARNQVGDFGLHLSLIRSFSWGDNFPVQSPFYPGVPLPYHYLFDLIAGMLSRYGVRIDTAVNGLSIVAMTALIYFLYRISLFIFGKSRIIGILSVLFFLSPGGWSFIDFFTSSDPTTWLSKWWRLPDYLHSGPFDGSIFSTYFTLNVYLNQRHLVAAMAVSLFLLFSIYRKLVARAKFFWYENIIYGMFLGIASFLHSLLFFGNVIIIGLLFIVYKRHKDAALFFVGVCSILIFRVQSMMGITVSHQWWNPGFLVPLPKSIGAWFYYWWQNIGVMTLLIPLGVYFASSKQRLLFWCFLPLFIVANVVQVSYRIEHNHSLLNYFFLIANMYGAYALVRMWHKHRVGKIVACLSIMAIGLNGLLQFTAIKNDYRYMTPDSLSVPLMSWIALQSPKTSVFIGSEELMNPVTLAGRYVYVGPSYYLDVMGYDSSKRRAQVKEYLERPTTQLLEDMRMNGISYVIISKNRKQDYPVVVDTKFYSVYTQEVYNDANYNIYKL